MNFKREIKLLAEFIHLTGRLLAPLNATLLSFRQYCLWLGSTAVGQSVSDAGAGVQPHKHFHHDLQPP